MYCFQTQVNNRDIEQTKKQTFKKDGSWVKFFSNEGVLLKKRTSPLGTEVFGPSPFTIGRKRLLSSFAGII